MPHKKSALGSLPPWILDIDDECLRDLVVQAVVARGFAERAGAANARVCPAGHAAFASAETTLEMIKDGRVVGRPAWKKAADALRKYTTALECAAPSRKAS